MLSSLLLSLLLLLLLLLLLMSASPAAGAGVMVTLSAWPVQLTEKRRNAAEPGCTAALATNGAPEAAA
jgi:hypothetical protein